jgi:peptidyl-dipeptidase Dcp
MRRSSQVFGLAFLLFVVGCSERDAAEQPVSESPETTNPLITESTLPYGMPPFDLIRDEHYVPAFERGMAEQSTEIEAIASNPEAATFENTIVAMERSGQLLEQAQRVFFSLSAAHINDTMQEIQTEMAPKFSAHDDNILLNGELFARVSSLYESRRSSGLDAESLRLLERYHTDFVRSGAELSEEEKIRLREINAELAELGTEFSQNVLHEVNDSAVVVDSRDELAGLTESQIESAAKEAESRELPGKYVLTLRNTTQQPPLTSLENRDLRQRIQEISEARGSSGTEYDNRGIVNRVLTLRAERSTLLGYDSHAAFILEDQTALTVDAVNDMLGLLGPRAVANARREAADLQALIDATEVEPFELASWDWLYYTEKLRQQRYNLDEAQLKPYFELNRSLTDGVFYMAEHLYGETGWCLDDRVCAAVKALEPTTGRGQSPQHREAP